MFHLTIFKKILNIILHNPSYIFEKKNTEELNGILKMQL